MYKQPAFICTVHRAKSGFTLLELSIVIVIIGLIAGSIIGVNSLIEAGEMRSITKEKDRYNTALNLFRDQYLQYPGDFDKATSLWGASHAAPTTCKNTASTGTSTCDGNGNGRISHCHSANAELYEMYLFWKHLSNAGLIEGRYTGIHGAGAAMDSYADVNVPGSDFEGGGWEVSFMDSTNGPCVGSYGPTPLTMDRNVIIFGSKRTNNQHEDKILTAVQARMLDQKIDDGKPRLGTMHYAPSWSSGCATITDYVNTDTEPNCNAVFFLK